MARVAHAAPPAAEAARISINVQAQPRFEEPRCRQTATGELELRAVLIDDVGTPLAQAPLEIATNGLPAGTEATSCAGSASPGRTRRARSGFRTNSDGEVCLSVNHAGAAAMLTLRFPGDALHLAARAEVPLRPVPAELHIAFETASLELNLDQPEQRLSLQLSGSERDGEPVPPLRISLEEAGHERTLESKNWLRSRLALSFTLRSEQLGQPGPARLLVRRASSAQREPVAAETVALRIATVRLSARSLSSTEDSAEIQVAAQSSVGAPPGGWVEASIAGRALGAGPVEGGQSHLNLHLPSTPPVTLELHYRSDEPWWQGGDATELVITPARVASGSHWPWLVVLAPIGYVCLRALERPAPRRERKPRRPARPVPVPRPTESPTAPVLGWNGIVRDAHDGRAIAGASIELILPSLRAVPPQISVSSDALGHFSLPPVAEPIPEGARLRISAPLHTEVERALPPQGRVDVALATRRRTVLARLVRWARAAGAPWQRSNEPTPRDIMNVAVRRGESATARWAQAVEAAVFGDRPVDGAHEAAVRSQEPAWQHGAERFDVHDE